MEKIDSRVLDLSCNLNDDFFRELFRRRGKGLIIKFKVEDAKNEKGYKKKNPLLLEGKVSHFLGYQGTRIPGYQDIGISD